jgi:hypothetical protein
MERAKRKLELPIESMLNLALDARRRGDRAAMDYLMLAVKYDDPDTK